MYPVYLGDTIMSFVSVSGNWNRKVSQRKQRQTLCSMVSLADATEPLLCTTMKPWSPLSGLDVQRLWKASKEKKRDSKRDIGVREGNQAMVREPSSEDATKSKKTWSFKADLWAWIKQTPILVWKWIVTKHWGGSTLTKMPGKSELSCGKSCGFEAKALKK